MQALQEQMCRRMNLVIGDDESEDENWEGNIDQAIVQEIHNPKEEKNIQAISKIGKRLEFDFPTFLENINLEKLIDWINK